MAPYAADTAVAARQQPRRPLKRIVPAVPFALSRAPRSTKPSMLEELVSETGIPPLAESQPAAEEAQKEEEKAEQQQTEAIQVPPTPESKASDIHDIHVEEPVPVNSQTDSQHHALEKSFTRDSPQEAQEEYIEEGSSSPSHNEPSVPDEEQSAATPPTVHPTPTELPPPFYPAENNHAEISPSDDADASPQPPSAHFPPHHTHPSVEGLVFGNAAYESPTVPSTPHELESDVTLQQQAFPRVPPGFAPPLFAAPFYPGHTHHPSDAGPAPWLYQQYTMAPPDAIHTHRQEYTAPPFQAGHVAYQASYQGQFSNPRGLHVLNGAARSHSQSPSKTYFGAANPNSDYEEESKAATYQNGNNLQSIDAKLEESPFELASYLASQFANPEFADFVLQLRSEDAVLLSLPIHGIVVARSPVIAQAIHSSTMSTYRTKDSRRLVDILIPDKFVTSESLNEAIKVLYGAPLLSIESFLYGLRPAHHDGEQGPTFTEARKRMSQAISYAAAGRALRIQSVYSRGIEIIKALLRWDTFDQALHFGLDGRPPRVSPASHQNGSAPDQPYPGNYGNYGIASLHDAIDFLAYNFPATFVLYTLAPELRLDPRLPNMVEPRSAAHNPRLSRIRFGDAPPEEDLNADYVTRILSSVLVSLPVLFLQRLFSHRATANQLGWTGVVKIMRDVVDEREKRRQKLTKGQLRPLQDGTMPQSLFENLYWEERVESSTLYASGFKISEVYLGDHV